MSLRTILPALLVPSPLSGGFRSPSGLTVSAPATQEGCPQHCFIRGHPLGSGGISHPTTTGPTTPLPHCHRARLCDHSKSLTLSIHSLLKCASVKCV
jgi:hypothetical protein